MNEKIISALDLNKIFKVKSAPVWVIKNISLDIKKSELVILFGPSGCGKSTLLNILLGLEPPTSGDLYLFGQKLNDMDVDDIALLRKEKVGIVYQQPNWIKSQSVLDNVAFPLLLRGIDENTARVKSLVWIEKLGLTAWANYQPTELSAGQQQKVALARALVTEPDLLIADEPTGNLDYQSGQELMQLFKKIQSEGRTVLIVTHERESLKYATRILRMIDGVIVDTIEVDGKDTPVLQQEIDSKIETSKVKELAGREPVIGEGVRHTSKRTNIIQNIRSLVGFIVESVKSLLLISVFLLIELIVFVGGKVGIRNMRDRLDIAKIFTPNVLKEYDTINSISLFRLALANLFTKRLRAFITIGGVGLGIGFIVLLISIGYGVEHLVIDRVAGLNELRQTEVLPNDDGVLPLTTEVVHDLAQIENVEGVMPVISVAGRVSYKGSSTDVVAYGVQSKLFEISDYQLLAGTYYTSDEVQENVDEDGVSVEVVDSEVVLPFKADRHTVVSQKFVELLGLSASNAIGETFEVSFIAGPPLVSSSEVKYTSTVTYEITGVISERDATEIYLPLTDLQDIGLGTYSQVRVVAADEESLGGVREQIEVMGYTTSSVTDTVEQIEQFFENVRTIFGVIGVVALVIGALGMFNTLTVSLLERTREIGLLKAIGMRSNEVSRLLLSEAMTMGWLGGATGIFVGVVGGKLLSLLFTVISVAQGLEPLDITYVPFWFAMFVLLLAVVVGAVTGIIPVRHARNISPIDALRYE